VGDKGGMAEAGAVRLPGHRVHVVVPAGLRGAAGSAVGAGLHPSGVVVGPGVDAVRVGFPREGAVGAPDAGPGTTVGVGDRCLPAQGVPDERCRVACRVGDGPELVEGVVGVVRGLGFGVAAIAGMNLLVDFGDAAERIVAGGGGEVAEFVAVLDGANEVG